MTTKYKMRERKADDTPTGRKFLLKAIKELPYRPTTHRFAGKDTKKKTT